MIFSASKEGNRASEGNAKEEKLSISEAKEGNDTKDGNPNTNEVNDANDTKDGIPNASEANDAKEGNLNTSEANDLTTDFSEDRQRTPCEVQVGPEQDLSELDKKISEQFSENSRNSGTLDGNATNVKDSVVDSSEHVSGDVGQENVNSEKMENRGPRLAPLGSLGGPRKPLPPLQKLAPLGSMDRQGSLGSLDKPTLGSLDKQRSLESPKTLDKAPLGSLKKEGGRQSSLESLGWKGGREEGRRGSSASSLLSNSSLGKRGSFLKAKKEEDEDEDEDDEDEEEVGNGGRVRGILKGSPLKDATDPREGSR